MEKEKRIVNIVVWGAGQKCKIVLEAIRKDKCNLVGIVDSAKKNHKTYYQDKWLIDAPEVLIDETVDYIIISVLDSDEILKQCKALGISDSRIIDYWKSDLDYDFIDANVNRIYELEKEMEKCKRHLRNISYEVGISPTPTIRPAKELLEIILRDKKSLSRFGDGDLEIMRRRERLWYQKPDDQLAERLTEVFCCDDERIIIALADDFGSLENYVDETKDAIRKYLDCGTREDLMQIIDLNRIYYDAYVTRPYIIYRNKSHAKNTFTLFKKIWENRDILLVEGTRSYIGVRNDLFETAASVRRIIAPAQNAFASYAQILSSVRENVAPDTLVLVSLGPTATILAYDMAMEGIQTLDIGQLDIEYEWYLRGTDKPVAIPGKCVAEIPWCHEVAPIADEDYEKQIIARIC